MNGAEIAVVIGAVAALAGLGWFFFAPRRAQAAELAGGVQRITVMVKGGYSPDVIRARQGIPLELMFDRQESGDCTSRVVFPDLAVSAALPAYERTTVRLAPPAAGSFGFACGMNMIHGTLIVDPDGEAAPVGGDAAQADAPPGAGPAIAAGEAQAAGAQDAEAAEAAERQAEISDLARRLAVGVVLTVPVLFAAMAASSLSVVSNANRLRRYHPAPLPAAAVTEITPQVETGSAHSHQTAEPGGTRRRHGSPSAHSPAADLTVTDPVCGMQVDPADAAAHRDTPAGTACFCSTGCAAAYDADPQRYAATTPAKAPGGGGGNR